MVKSRVATNRKPEGPRCALSSMTAWPGSLQLMDRAWMRERLEQYLALCERYESSERSAGYNSYTDSMRSIDHEAETLQPTVERIFRALDPELLDDLLALGYSPSNIASRIRQALGILRDQDEWALRLAPNTINLGCRGEG